MNKITTQGYFIKRLRDCGYYIDKLYVNYYKMDPRQWSVVIDPGLSNIFCTYYVNHNSLGEQYFEMYDGGQFIPGRFNIKTNSIEIIVEYLNKFNIAKKDVKLPPKTVENNTPIK
jgi:hypothetical protein